MLYRDCVQSDSDGAYAALEICFAKGKKTLCCIEIWCKVLLTWLMRPLKSALQDLLKIEVNGGFLLCRDSAFSDICTANVV